MLQIVKSPTAVAARESEITATLRKASYPEINCEARSVERRASDWQKLPREVRKSDDFPQNLDTLSRSLAPLLEPGGVKAATVLLARLFSAVPPPTEDAMEIWIEFLSPYPADTVKRAVDELIRTHRWNVAPLVGNIIAAIDGDQLHAARLGLSREIQRTQAMIARWQRDDERQARIDENEKAMRQRAEAAQKRGEDRGHFIYELGTVIARLRRLSTARERETTPEMTKLVLLASESEEDELFRQDTPDDEVLAIYHALTERQDDDEDERAGHAGVEHAPAASKHGQAGL